MNKLTVLNGQAVVTSRQIGDDFSRLHKDVINSIEKLIEGIGKSSSTYFIESQYESEQNKQMYKEYLITKDGFTLLVMGFNGPKALEWKLKYIQAFNEMEQLLKTQTLLTPKEQLKLQLQVLEEQDKKIEVVSDRLSKVENTMTIDYSQQQEMNSKAKSRVVTVLGGKDTPAYKELNKKAFSSIWRDYQRVMAVNSYRNTAVKNYINGMAIIQSWIPCRELELMIKGCNLQIGIKGMN